MARPIYVVNKSAGRGVKNTGTGRTQLELRAEQVGLHKGKHIEWAESEGNVQTLHQGEILRFLPAKVKGFVNVIIRETGRNRVCTFMRSLTPAPQPAMA